VINSLLLILSIYTAPAGTNARQNGDPNIHANNTVDSTIQLFNETGLTRYLCKLNQIGNGKDGEFAEYYGYSIVEYLLLSKRKCEFLAYLARSPKRLTKHIETAIAQEYYIRHEQNQKLTFDKLMTADCPSSQRARLKKVYRRILHEVNRIPGH